ncbi:MAG TPA: PLP-dependent transferase [Luteolibacter sp.]|nr:PLP-dependent transferase [Luteolibacter sp.]
MIASPAWQAEDLGQALPDSIHACSVSLPTWKSIIGYEEKEEKVVKKMRLGYPRFLRNPLVERLFEKAKAEVASEGEEVLILPTRASVLKAHRWVEVQAQTAVRITSFHGLQALIVPAKAREHADHYWRFTGEVVSSRQAQDHLNGAMREGSKSHLISKALAKLVGSKPEETFVLTSGMAAITAVVRCLPGVAEGRKTLQMEFPYVDSLKVQEHFGAGVVYLNEAEGESFDEALMRIRQGEFAGVFTEVPSNPLLRTVNLKRVALACREGDTPLIVDDSAGGPFNIDALRYADVVTGSLTKWVSGQGDVMAGMIALRPDSKFTPLLQPLLQVEAEQTAPLYIGDAEVLLSNMKGYGRRMRTINAHGEKLANWLAQQPAVGKVWYPSLHHREYYDAVKRDKGGYGGLISFVLKQPKKTAKFYDALQLNKGPSFGTPFTLVCAYMMLAHYYETEWTEACGVPTELLRVSCGLEPIAQIIRSFEDAFKAIA